MDESQAPNVAPEPGIKKQGRNQGADVYADARLGVVQFNIYLAHDAMEETLEAYGEEIIPGLEARSAV